MTPDASVLKPEERARAEALRVAALLLREDAGAPEMVDLAMYIISDQHPLDRYDAEPEP